jgi:RES domain-containing protein
MIVYRLAKSKYIHDLSGTGAEKTGGRWSSKGVAVVYTSQSRALCLAEVAVHIGLGYIPTDYMLAEIEIPESVDIYEIKPEDLSRNWKSIPHSNTTQEIGDKLFSENKYLVIKVPSAVVQGEFNYLINPHHADSKKVKIIKTEKFTFDDRIFIK